MKKKSKTRFHQLKRIFEILHGPNGCLWDKKQTYKSLIPCLKEEAGEIVSAVRKKDYHNLKEEVGDLLLLVMFYSQIAKKEGRFDIEDVIVELIKKLKRRHPHVFAGAKATSAHQIIRNWHKIKKGEKKKS